MIETLTFATPTKKGIAKRKEEKEREEESAKKTS